MLSNTVICQPLCHSLQSPQYISQCFNINTPSQRAGILGNPFTKQEITECLKVRMGGGSSERGKGNPPISWKVKAKPRKGDDLHKVTQQTGDRTMMVTLLVPSPDSFSLSTIPTNSARTVLQWTLSIGSCPDLLHSSHHSPS